MVTAILGIKFLILQAMNQPDTIIGIRCDSGTKE